MDWDTIHSAVLLIGMVVIVTIYPRNLHIVHLIGWLGTWTFGYYIFAKQVVPPTYQP